MKQGALNIILQNVFSIIRQYLPDNNGMPYRYEPFFEAKTRKKEHRMVAATFISHDLRKIDASKKWR